MEEDRGNFKNKKFWHFMYCTNNQNFLLSKIRIRLRLLLSTSHKSTIFQFLPIAKVVDISLQK